MIADTTSNILGYWIGIMAIVFVAAVFFNFVSFWSRVLGKPEGHAKETLDEMGGYAAISRERAAKRESRSK